MNNNILDIKNLDVTFETFDGEFSAVNGVSLSIDANESIGVIGESGCGKSTLSFAIMNYLAKNASISGDIYFKGKNLFEASEKELSSIRGNRIAMVFQNPYSSLNPALTIGYQLDEVGIHHQRLSKSDARKASIEALATLNIGDPEGVANRYPHQLSGGIQQRVSIAMAILCHPDLMILDEPTTALDVTTESVILESISELRQKLNMSLMYISHDIGVINKVADTIAVMYSGEIVEKGPKETIFTAPLHPYTRSLINCLPRAGVVKEKTQLNTIAGYVKKRGVQETGCPFAPRCEKRTPTCEQRYKMREIESGHWAACDRAYATDVPNSLEKLKPKVKVREHQDSSKTLLKINSLHKVYRGQKKKVYALNGISVDVKQDSVIGIVGESGCGKSTTGHMVGGLFGPTSGEILFDNQDISMPWNKRSLEMIKSIQLIFQNPGRSLNPSHTVEQIISRPMKKLKLQTNREQRRNAIKNILKRVDLGEEYLEKKPRQLSGGEQQRVAIARAISISPQMVVLDEPTSALDVSVQASVLNLLNELQIESQATYMFISHDLHVINYLCDYIMVMYGGKICEYGKRDEVMNPPSHPYSEALLSAKLEIDPSIKRKAIHLEGQLPDPTVKITGCPFASRCHKKVGPICDTTYPPKQQVTKTHYYNCHILPTQL